MGGRRVRGRGTHPRIPVDQRVHADLQRRFPRQQVLSLPGGLVGRGISQGVGDPPRAQEGHALPRPVHESVGDTRDARPAAERVPHAFVHEEPVQPGPAPGPPLPVRAHWKMQRAVHRKGHARRASRNGNEPHPVHGRRRLEGNSDASQTNARGGQCRRIRDGRQAARRNIGARSGQRAQRRRFEREP